METSVFSRLVKKSSNSNQSFIDCVHLNDHHTAPLAYLLNQARDRHHRAMWEETSIVFAVHNNLPAYQGLYEAEDRAQLSFAQDSALFRFGGAAEYHNKINYLKMGMISSDVITYVSRQFMVDALTNAYGSGLDGVAHELLDQGRLWGVLNGIDHESWDPAQDEYIQTSYHGGLPAEDIMAAKLKNKSNLQNELGLPVSDVPVFGMVARLTPEKGFQAAIQSVHEQIERNRMIQFVFSGDGSLEIQKALQTLTETYPNNVRLTEKFTREMERKIIAGSDIMMVFSEYEPCGLPQIYAMRYGTLPWVHAVGGLHESIDAQNEVGDTWNGFKYTSLPKENYEDIQNWFDLAPKVRQEKIKEIMSQDFSWINTAVPEYQALYRNAGYDRLFRQLLNQTARVEQSVFDEFGTLLELDT